LNDFSNDIAKIRVRAEAAAGPLVSMRLRSVGYLELYDTSKGGCTFALVAAHGALWASWYLICARFAAMFFAIFDISGRLSTRDKYRQFDAYVLVLKTINQLVMVESYVLIHCIKELGREAAMQVGYPSELVDGYGDIMDGQYVEVEQLRHLYHVHFEWEQERVVSNALDEGFAVFTWVFMRNLCQRPWVWFSYFKVGKSMNFKSFTDRDERIEKGLIAFDRASELGFDVLSFRTRKLVTRFNRLRGRLGMWIDAS
jgi:hypothetical protein